MIEEVRVENRTIKRDADPCDFEAALRSRPACQAMPAMRDEQRIIYD